MPRDGKTELRSSESERTRPSRRQFIGGAATAASVVALAGCTGGGGDGGDGGDGGGGDGGDGGSTGEADVADEIAIAAVEGSGRLFKRLINDYVQDDAGVQVNVSLFPYANLFEKTSSVLNTQGQAYDIVYMDDPWFPQLAMDVDPIRQWMPEDIPEEQIIDTTIDIATWPAPRGPIVPSAEGMEEQLRGQIVVGNTQLFAYNEAYYEQVGASAPPKTWDDVLSAGQAIDEQIDGANGYIIRGKRGNPINANFFGLGNCRIGNMFDENWRYQWDSDRGVNTLDFYVNDLESISPDGVTSFDSDQVLSGLADGSAAQSPAWPSAASLLLDPEQADEADNIAFTPIPEGVRRAPQQGNWIAGINSYVSDAKKRAAGRVIRSTISKEAQNRYVELGGVPFRHDTFQDNMDAQQWFQALYDSLQTAQWRPRTPLWNEIAVTQGQNLNSALSGSTSPEEAMTTINDEIESTLEDAGYYE
ncbi:ABC transporter substrate-binding protein [Halobacteriales archaeon QS_1_68_17]|nr:MAG: ABC transporter substrate-binding protein [Halobacteriales archaeon QS_1_68_17]